MPSADEEPAPKWWRGVVNKEDYKRNVIRNAKVKGEGYYSHSGKTVAEKSKPSLDSSVCECHGKCSKQINHEIIDEIWDYFYSIENKNSQVTYIQ